MSGEKKNSLMAGLLFLGLVLVGISFYWSSHQTPSQNSEEMIAEVDLELGTAFVLHPRALNPQKIEKKIPLHNLESVQTQDTGEALITFSSGARVRVAPSSLVTVEKGNSDFLVILKQGFVQVENSGPERSLVILKNGERIAAEVYNSTQTLPIGKSRGQPQAPEKTIDTLSSQEISETMARQKNTFYKCYTQLLQKDIKAHGSVSLSFTVENTGKVRNAEASSAELADPIFKRCLIEVMKRIEFRSFQGDPVSTLFPIKFE